MSRKINKWNLNKLDYNKGRFKKLRLNFKRRYWFWQQLLDLQEESINGKTY